MLRIMPLSPAFYSHKKTTKPNHSLSPVLTGQTVTSVVKTKLKVRYVSCVCHPETEVRAGKCGICVRFLG